MKSKLLLGSGLLLVAAMMAIGFTSCEKLTLDQAVTLAKIGGMASAQTWVMAAKPTPAIQAFPLAARMASSLIADSPSAWVAFWNFWIRSRRCGIRRRW
jgi:hypothetical protein